jgi:hypothetical protein
MHKENLRLSKELKTTIIPYEASMELDFNPPSAYYFRMASGDLCFIHTRIRQDAQAYCDEFTGVKGKYKIIAAKDVKTKSSREDGGLSCTGTATRAKPSSRPPR